MSGICHSQLEIPYLCSGKYDHAFLFPQSSTRRSNTGGLRKPTLLAPPSSSKNQHSDIPSVHWLRIITIPHETKGLHLGDVFLTVHLSLTAEKQSLETFQAHPTISIRQMKNTAVQRAWPHVHDHTVSGRLRSHSSLSSAWHMGNS